jgi:hypothetical protein
MAAGGMSVRDVPGLHLALVPPPPPCFAMCMLIRDLRRSVVHVLQIKDLAVNLSSPVPSVEVLRAIFDRFSAVGVASRAKWNQE